MLPLTLRVRWRINARPRVVRLLEMVAGSDHVDGRQQGRRGVRAYVHSRQLNGSAAIAWLGARCRHRVGKRAACHFIAAGSGAAIAVPNAVNPSRKMGRPQGVLDVIVDSCRLDGRGRQGDRVWDNALRCHAAPWLSGAQSSVCRCPGIFGTAAAGGATGRHTVTRRRRISSTQLCRKSGSVPGASFSNDCDRRQPGSMGATQWVSVANCTGRANFASRAWSVNADFLFRVALPARPSALPNGCVPRVTRQEFPCAS